MYICEGTHSTHYRVKIYFGYIYQYKYWDHGYWNRVRQSYNSSEFQLLYLTYVITRYRAQSGHWSQNCPGIRSVVGKYTHNCDWHLFWRSENSPPIVLISDVRGHRSSPRTVSTFHSCASLVAIPYSSTHGICSELKTLECDILNPDLLVNLEIKFMR